MTKNLSSLENTSLTFKTSGYFAC